jgi:hypothetical protein
MGSRAFSFRTSDEAWAFINVASTAGYALYEAISPVPMMGESMGGGTHIVAIPADYDEFTHDLRRLKSSVTSRYVESALNFDRFMRPSPEVTRTALGQEDDSLDVARRLRASRSRESWQNRVRYG